MKCKNCKYWFKEENDYHNSHSELGLGECNAVIQFWDATEWSDLGERTIKEQFRNNLAFTQDGSDYASYLLTMPNFGCVQFKKKD